MKSRIYILIALLIIMVALLAFFLRGPVQIWVIIPLAKFFWLVKGYYGAFPQAAYWVVALIVAAVIAILGLRLPNLERPRLEKKMRPVPGTVREMSFWIQRARDRFFPKWHIAHILGELALDILDRRGTHEKNTRLLSGLDWDPPADVKKYLDAALTTNYTDYPKPKRFSSSPPTPFDQDLEPVIKYLESLLENENDHNS
ncbi:MAG: hypothetical protein ABSG01_04265 [Anaerolineales bacterium]|jgi:hypothetical protein